MKNHRNQSVMKHQFSEVPVADIPRSSFNRDHGYKTTFDAGKLIPFYIDEVVPGDTFNVEATLLARLNTPIFPIMDNMFLDTHFFAVPLRLVWSNFKRFMGEQPNPGDSTDFTIPVVAPTSVTGFVAGELFDYFGLPTTNDALTACPSVNALFSRAYNLIWNEWFRDQNLQDAVTVDLDDGPDDEADYVLLNRGKRHDYFTSCLPWPQKGDAVDLPLGVSAPVERVSNAGAWDAYLSGTDTLQGASTVGVNAGGEVYSGANTLSLDPAGGLVVDLSSATAATINSLREAFQLQRLLERDARGGTRYIELIKSHFRVTSPDARQQRPEFLGGRSERINISPVAQTSSTDVTTPQANLSAVGDCVSYNNGFVKSFTEHCVIIGLCSVRADLTYQQGIPRMFSRETKYDFYWPALAHLGEQEVYNKEIYAQGISDDDLIFGYQERWAEYRYYPSKITGLMRSTHPQSLDAWHLSQQFTSLPTLSDAFIQENPPIDRVVAVNTEPDFKLDVFIKNRTARPMPVYSVPGLIDHF